MALVRLGAGSRVSRLIEMRADGDLHGPALGVLRVSQQISGQSPVMDGTSRRTVDSHPVTSGGGAGQGPLILRLAVSLAVSGPLIERYVPPYPQLARLEQCRSVGVPVG